MPFYTKDWKQVVQAESRSRSCTQYMARGYSYHIVTHDRNKNVIATAHTAADIYPNLKLVHFIQRHCIRVFTNITLTAEKSFRQFMYALQYYTTDKITKRNHLRSIMHYLRTYRYVKIHATFHICYFGVVSRLEKIKEWTSLFQLLNK